MKKNEIIKALKEGKSKEEFLNIIGSPEVNLDTIKGGNVSISWNSSGFICSISGECNASGRSCWDW